MKSPETTIHATCSQLAFLAGGLDSGREFSGNGGIEIWRTMVRRRKTGTNDIPTNGNIPQEKGTAIQQDNTLSACSAVPGPLQSGYMRHARSPLERQIDAGFRLGSGREQRDTLPMAADGRDAS
jgi:hypothetical protein